MGAADDECEQLRQQVSELQNALHERAQSQRTLDRELVEARAIVKELERQHGAMKRTLAFQLGQAMIAIATLRGLMLFPLRIYRILRDRPKLRAARKSARAKRPAEQLRFVEETMHLLRSQGLAAATDYVARIPERAGREKARAYVELALAVHGDDPDGAVTLAEAAARINPAESRLRAFAFALYEEGRVRHAARVLRAGSPDLLSSAAQQALGSAIMSDDAELTTQSVVVVQAARDVDTATTIAIIGHRSLPSHAEAATYRAHAVAEDARARGIQALIVTEPGYRYPAKGDGRPQRNVAADGIVTIRLPAAGSHSGDVTGFVAAVSAMLATQFAEDEVGHVHITAGPPLALAAAVAASTAGIPYTLDVGALPIANGAGRSGWLETERFAAAWSRLAAVANAAHEVVVRSAPLRAALMRRLPGLAPTLIADALPPRLELAGAGARREVRRSLGVGERRTLIGIVSEADEDGRLLEFVRAMPDILRRQPDAVLVFCGSSRIGLTVRHEAALLGITEAVCVPEGFVRQRLNEYVSCFSAMLFPAQEEAAGLSAPFELRIALALGTPVVAIASEWAHELVDPAVTVPPGDRAMLVDALVTAVRQAPDGGERSVQDSTPLADMIPEPRGKAMMFR